MIEYDYVCEACNTHVTIPQSIKDKPISTCPKCNRESLVRQISGGLCAFVRDPSGSTITLGQQAERNTKAMGTYELQEKRRLHKTQEKAARKRAVEESGGTYVDRPDEHKPFYGTADHNKINKMTAKQKEKYIFEGKQ